MCPGCRDASFTAGAERQLLSQPRGVVAQSPDEPILQAGGIEKDIGDCRGIALGAAAIAGEEDAGTLEYTLSSTATRSQILITRFAGVFTVLFGVAGPSGLALLVTAPLFNLANVQMVTVDGKTLTNPGLGPSNVAAGTVAALRP